jgi:hypothetical protein
MPSEASRLNDLTVAVLNKVSDAKVNVSVAYAEAAKTSDLILDTARRVDRAYRAFRRGQLRVVARELNISAKTVHKTWLAYKYGWIPLLMDVKNGAEFFAQQHVGRPQRFRVQDAKLHSKSGSTSESLDSGRDTLVRTWEATLRNRLVLDCEITNPQLSQLQQLGLTNPALVAWELIPFSFVFDWFISVGSWLQGLTALHGVAIRRAMFSGYHEVKTTRVYSNGAFTSGLASYSASSSHTQGTFRSYARSPVTISPGNTMPPVNRDPFSFGRLVTSLALIKGNYRPARL